MISKPSYKFMVVTTFISLTLAVTSLIVDILELFQEDRTEIVVKTFDSIDFNGPVGGMEFVLTKGLDESGKKADLVISVLSREFNWKIGSTSQVELNGTNIDYVEYISSPSFKEAFKQCTDIVALGMASKEGYQKTEEKRSRSRGIQLTAWLRLIVDPKPHLWLLNIGQYKGSDPLASSMQRRIIFICIFNKEEGVELRSALIKALQENPAFNFPLEDYSLYHDVNSFEMQR